MTSPIPEVLPSVLMIAALNPAVIAVALYMGAKADQWQKLIVAAFAAALAGSALIWLGTLTQIPLFSFLATPARAAGGIFVAQFFTGFIWAAIGYKLFRKA
jgi:hypothetical protein